MLQQRQKQDHIDTKLNNLSDIFVYHTHIQYIRMPLCSTILEHSAVNRSDEVLGQLAFGLVGEANVGRVLVQTLRLREVEAGDVQTVACVQSRCLDVRLCFLQKWELVSVDGEKTDFGGDFLWRQASQESLVDVLAEDRTEQLDRDSALDDALDLLAHIFSLASASVLQSRGQDSDSVLLKPHKLLRERRQLIVGPHLTECEGLVFDVGERSGEAFLNIVCVLLNGPDCLGQGGSARDCPLGSDHKPGVVLVLHSL